MTDQDIEVQKTGSLADQVAKTQEEPDNIETSETTGIFAQLLQQRASAAAESSASKAAKADAELLVPQADESILKNTKLLQVQPVPDFDEVVKTPSSEEVGCLEFDSPWQGIELEKIRLNKYINLGYVSEANLKLVIERLHSIQTDQQKKFKKIIKEMQKDGNESKLSEYSSRIVVNQEGYNFNIVFLDFSRYLKSWFHPPTRRLLQVADLVYPQGFLMQWAFRTLSAKMHEIEAEAQNKQSFDFCSRFDFTVNLLSDLDEFHCSAFLIGGKVLLLNRVEDIFKISFHNIKILGRYTARYRKEKRIAEIQTVINKSTPTILLVAKRANIHDFIDSKHGKRNIKSFIVLDYPEALHDFSGKYHHKKTAILKIIQPLSYLVFPWKWPKLFCVLLFLLKVFFLTLVGVEKDH